MAIWQKSCEWRTLRGKAINLDHRKNSFEVITWGDPLRLGEKKTDILVREHYRRPGSQLQRVGVPWLKGAQDDGGVIAGCNGCSYPIHRRTVNDVGEVEPLTGDFDEGTLAVDELTVVSEEFSIDRRVGQCSHGLVSAEGEEVRPNAPLNQRGYSKGETLVAGGCYLLADGFGSDVGAGRADIE